MSINSKNYQKLIQDIIEDENTQSVHLVGSCKNIDLESDINKVNDIDIFILTNNGESQLRDTRVINNIEYDINYFPKIEIKRLLEKKEYFFIKEMKDAKTIYDRNNYGQEVIIKSTEIFIEGPKKLQNDEIQLLKIDIKSKIDNIKKMSKFEEIEYHFLTNLYLRDIIVGYFIINNEWIPKDKKIFNEVKKKDIMLYNLIQQINLSDKYESLINIYEYVFERHN